VSSGVSYAAKLGLAQARAGLDDALVSGVCTLEGRMVALTVCDFRFMGASMGSVYGEKLRRAAERAAGLGIPLLTVNSSGGARMQEGIIALMQMVKITLALTRLAAAPAAHRAAGDRP
jgi:acetyl-CoA carboxylase carboxyl transferase subunit beta